MCIRAPSTRTCDQLIGGHRDKVPAYGTTMCGSELEARHATLRDYKRFSETLTARGNKGIKLHTWMPPVIWSPNGKMDLKACAAVRDDMGGARLTNNSARSGAFSPTPWRANEQ
jgi:L-alanine-DL-glutamate epimerase-like enolase superfamily enzyme